MDKHSQLLFDHPSGGRLKRERATAVEGNVPEKGSPHFSRCDTDIEAKMRSLAE